MSLEFIILGLLRAPKSGYDLKAEFEAGVANFWPAELSQVYVTLKRLRRRGWLRDRVAASAKGPARRVYRRAPAGTKALHAWLAGEPLIGDERYSYAAQVYFLDELADAQLTLRFFTILRQRLTERYDALRAIEQGWAKASPEYPDRLPSEEFHQQLTLRLGLHTAAARLMWCEESIHRLRARVGRRKKDA
jgi:DNA-binding PadR family transcriptional regulator